MKDIVAWGEHLVFQFDTFALRVHFMLWGTFAATVDGTSVTGDYRRSGPPRLVLNFSNGEITMWAASVKFIEGADAKAGYALTADVMADEWDPKATLSKTRAFPRAEIAAVLLDQAISAASATSSRTRCCLARAQIRSRRSETYRTESCDRLLLTLVRSHSVFSSCVEYPR